MKIYARFSLLREIGTREGGQKAISKLGMSILSLKTVQGVVDEFVELNLIRLIKEKNKIVAEITDVGKHILLCDNSIEALGELYG